MRGLGHRKKHTQTKFIKKFGTNNIAFNDGERRVVNIVTSYSMKELLSLNSHLHLVLSLV